MNSVEALKLAILEYEKDLETDENNQWVKNVLKGLKKCQQDLEIVECFKKIPKQDLKDFIEWQIRYEKNLNTWLEGCNADLAKEDPTKHLIKIKEWLEK